MSKYAGKHVKLYVGNSGNTAMVEMDITTVTGPLEYNASDTTNLGDAIVNNLPGHLSSPVSCTGVMTTAAKDAMVAIVGDGLAHSLDIQIASGSTWTSGTDPQFGLTQDGSGNGYSCFSFSFDVGADAITYAATFNPIGGGLAPAFGTAAETAS